MTLFDSVQGDLDEQAILLRDPHRYEGAIRNITARELLRMIDRAVKNYSQIKVPFFCMHGTADTIALVSGSRELYMGVSTPWAKRTFVIYPGLHHELFHESPVARAACIADAVRYYDETLMKHAAPVYSQDNDDVDVSVM